MTKSLMARKATTETRLELLEFVSSLVCLIDKGGVTFVNRAGSKILELEAVEDAVGLPFETFVVEDYRFLVEAGWELLALEEFVPLKLKRSSGAVFDAEMRVRQVSPDTETFLLEIRDISKYVKSAEALREREERLHGILHSVAEGIITVNEAGMIESANPAVERMFAFANGQMLGRSIGELMPDDRRGLHPHLFSAYLSGQHPELMGRTVEGMGQRNDGRLFPIEISVSEFRHSRKRLFTAVLRDISERKENEDRIRRLAHHDHLTGLPNRNLLNDRMNHALARIKRHGGRMAVLYIDLDRFKPVNDAYGHEAGDCVLKEVASRLMACVRSSDTVARVGGDEFVVVTEEMQRPAEAALVARKIVDSLSRPFPVFGAECTIGASIGIALFPDDGYTVEDVSKAADVAMYRVKHSGRNGYCFFAMAADHPEDIDEE
ncbi:MAG: sensor domain-containing diguanylate cyclase [Magnetospirillum sp.]|nr:sensor domain-containing diguanylate cyclase [Magnetospirillum sp.]